MANGADFDTAILHTWPKSGPALEALSEQWGLSKAQSDRVRHITPLEPIARLSRTIPVRSTAHWHGVSVKRMIRLILILAFTFVDAGILYAVNEPLPFQRPATIFNTFI